MLKKRFWVSLIFIASCVNIFAQDVDFSVSAPKVVAVGEQFRVIFKLNARPQEFNAPAFDNFYILAGPSTSSSSSIQIVNGQMTQTHEYSYTYILEATESGKFQIGSASATVSKKEYKTNPFAIEVVSGGSGTQPATPRNQQSTTSASNAAEQESENMFIDIEFDRRTAYRGQPILATLKLYTRQNIAGFDDFKFPSFNGFWSQEIETPNNIRFQRQNVNGRIYNVGVLKKYLLLPQRAGDINIKPFELVVLAQQQGRRSGSIFDDFFGSHQTVKVRLLSKEKTLKIRDLPPNAPSSFTGAVGDFSLTASLDKTAIKTNEAVNLTVRVSGTGNIKLIETPKFEFPSSFEIFDPKVTDNINTTSQGATGSKTFEFVAIPRGPGDFNLGSLEFSYFNPIQKKYITLKSKSLNLTVEADGSEQVASPMVGFGREDVRFIGKDIRFIKTEGIKISKTHNLLFASNAYYGIIVLLLVVFIALFWFIQHNRKLMGNIALVKTRKANKVASKRLKEAKKHLSLSNVEPFYEELLKALWGYVADKLSIPVANLSSDTVRETLEQNNVQDVDIDEFLRIIATCEYARYAPKSEASQMTNLYNSAISLIAKLEGVIKNSAKNV
ncbi:MAG: BatD family protein [Bacteroidales bacterium]|nr:BatD family protein [Bacteroidales bacterium]MDD4671864.1 BatD family protein [Bacteroidales bacterium]MDY0348239.1 BatD family protein [Tenuifilaceae bacterium]